MNKIRFYNCQEDVKKQEYFLFDLDVPYSIFHHFVNEWDTLGIVRENDSADVYCGLPPGLADLLDEADEFDRVVTAVRKELLRLIRPML